MRTERDLKKLLAGIDAELQSGQWVFCAELVPGALMTFRELEGITSIIEKSRADEMALPYSLVSAWITLRVYSDLEAVGFIAVISTALAAKGIACNVVSAFHHDHLFVPVARADEAMNILRKLAS